MNVIPIPSPEREPHQSSPTSTRILGGWTCNRLGQEDEVSCLTCITRYIGGSLACRLWHCQIYLCLGQHFWMRERSGLDFDRPVRRSNLARYAYFLQYGFYCLNGQMQSYLRNPPLLQVQSRFYHQLLSSSIQSLQKPHDLRQFFSLQLSHPSMSHIPPYACFWHNDLNSSLHSDAPGAILVGICKIK